MQDMLTQLEKLRRDAAECELIRDLATDPKKRESLCCGQCRTSAGLQAGA